MDHNRGQIFLNYPWPVSLRIYLRNGIKAFPNNDLLDGEMLLSA